MKTILVPVDFNPLSTAALQYAAQVAELAGAALVVTYADTFIPPAEFTALQTATLAATLAESRTRAGQELEAYAHENVPETISLKTEVRDALPVTGILAAIAEHRPDLVVMGTHGRGGLSRLVFGSVAEAVLARRVARVITINRVDTVFPPRELLCIAPCDEPVRLAAVEVAEIFGTDTRTVEMTRESVEAILASRSELIVIGGEDHAVTRYAASPVMHVPGGG